MMSHTSIQELLLKEHRILIVEDEGIAALEIKELLEQEGYEVGEPVDTANKVVEAVLGSRIDLILMDINLNGFIDGIDAAQRIKIMKDIPIIYLTAYPNNMIEQRALKTRPAAYLEKPVQTDKLLKIIDETLSFQTLH